MKILIVLIILIIILIGLNYLYKENFDASSIFTGLLTGSILYLCAPCICSCCMLIILVIFLKLAR